MSACEHKRMVKVVASCGTGTVQTSGRVCRDCGACKVSGGVNWSSPDLDAKILHRTPDGARLYIAAYVSRGPMVPA